MVWSFGAPCISAGTRQFVNHLKHEAMNHVGYLVTLQQQKWSPPQQACSATPQPWQPHPNTQGSLSSKCQLRLTTGSPWHHQQMSSSTRANCYHSTFHHGSKWLKSSSRLRLTRASSLQALPQRHHTSRAMFPQQIHVMLVVSSIRSIISTNAHPPVLVLLMWN